MASLSSLLVQRHVATIAEVEQAISRQVMHGGDLLTNLLEVSARAERGLAHVLGESLGMQPAPPGRLPAPEAELLELLPVEVALRHGIFPLRTSGKTLVFATSEALSAAAERDLTAALGLELGPIASPLIRIREGIAAHYGVPLEARQLRLVQRLDALEAGPRSSVRPPPPPASDPVWPVAAGLPSGLTDRPPEAGLRATPVPAESRPHLALTAESLPPAPFAQVAEPRASSRPAPISVPPPSAPPPALPPLPAAPPSLPPSVPPVASVDAAGGGADLDGGWDDVTAAAYSPSGPPPADVLPPDDTPRPPGMVDPRAVMGLMRREVESRRQRGARTARRKGPFSRADGERELEAATTPDGVLGAFFAFGSQFFEYSALFVVHGDMAEGRDAFGPGTDIARVQGIGVPLDLPSSLAEARREGRVLLTRLDAHELDRELRRDLGRSRAALAALVPLTVKGRSVAVLVGDDGANDVTLASLGELLGFSALASTHIERIAMSRKRGKAEASAGRAQPASVAALARAFSAPGAKKSSAAVAPVVGTSSLAASAPPPPRESALPPPSRPAGVAHAPTIPLPAQGAAAHFARRHTPTVAGLEPLVGAVAKRHHSPAEPHDAPPPSGRTIPQSLQPVRMLQPVSAEEGEAFRDAGVSPGAASVHPPATRDDETRPYDGGVLAPVGAPSFGGATLGAYAAPEVHDATRLGGAAVEEEAPLTVQMRPALASDSPGPFAAYDPEPFSGRPTRPGAWPEMDAAWTAAIEGRPTMLGDSPVERSLPSSPPPTVVRPASSAPDSLGRPAHAPPIPREDEDASRLLADYAADTTPGTGRVARGSEPPPTQRISYPPSSDVPPRVTFRSSPPGPESSRAGAYTVIPERTRSSRAGGDPDIVQLVERAGRGGLEGEEALSELVRETEHHFPRMVAIFPGPLSVDRHRMRSDLPLASECGPLLKLLVMMRRAALPFMTVRSAMPDADQRFWATHVLGELLFPEASNAVLPRLFDDDVGVRRVARRAAQALVAAGAPGEPLRTSLAHTMKSPEEATQRRVLAIEALSEIRLPAVVPALVEGLRDPSEAISEASRRALVAVTRQDFESSASAWFAWWDAHQHQHRVEWLIDALTHEASSLRRAAGDELKHLTKEYFGYYDDLPPREREKAQALYRRWWSEEGQYRFR